MKGKIFGIGVGPGDPELLTLKAINALQKCDVIAVPKAGGAEKTAFSIIERYVGGKELLECAFAMHPDIEKRREARRAVADSIIGLLNEGKSVGFITLGDPTVYSTYMYVHRIIADKGFDAEIIPGVTSYTAAAAALGVALCEEDEPLIIIPATNSQDIDDLLDCPANKVVMKSGEGLMRILKRLKDSGYEDRTMLVSRVTMDGERIYAGIDDYESSGAGYFTIAIVKNRRG